MRLKSFLISSFAVLLISIAGNAQAPAPADTSHGRKIIQFSGLAVDADSLTPIPYVVVMVRNSTRGVYSNGRGYYSIVAQEKDTIDYYAFGYRKATFVLPDTFKTSQFSYIQALRMDTILLRQVVIYPWPSKEKFKQAFLSLNIPNDDMERARYNLAQAATIQSIQNVAIDAGLAYSNGMQQRVQKNYTAGQYPVNNLLNPVAWARFIEALRNGDLKRQ